jgi:hypothetical protein
MCHYSYGWEKLHCLYIYHIFFDPFISGRAPGLFPKLGYCEECCDGHWCTGVSVVSWLKFHPGTVLLDHMAVLSLAYWGISIWLFIVVY